ncbi:hypothetical protein [Aquimarina sp. LLG6339-5]|uniref:hypothetical protein n=1 Tax=Aquimarina sp. LLG6339-5 TaxID=3160830 RepID=UPI00386DED9A
MKKVKIKRVRGRIILLLLGFMSIACSDDNTPPTNDVLMEDNKIVSFEFLASENDALTNATDIVGVISDSELVINLNIVSINALSDIDITNLKPNIEISEGATIHPSPEEAQDFTNGVEYTVTAENGDSASYLVFFLKESSENKILSFKFLASENDVLTNATDVVGVISDSDVVTNLNVISLNVPSDTDITNLKPNIETSEGSAISPNPEEAQNFTNVVEYTVTAENGNSLTYKVIVLKEESSENEILSFDFLANENDVLTNAVDIFGDISNDVVTNLRVISLTVPSDTDVTNLKPSIEISEGATINPSPQEAQNFTNAVEYTVTAENGETSTYKVIVLKETQENKIIRFDLLASDNEGFLNQDIIGGVATTSVSNLILLTVPSNTDITNLKPSIEVPTGYTITPPSGQAQDFTGILQYVITSENRDVFTYVVRVIHQND